MHFTCMYIPLFHTTRIDDPDAVKPSDWDDRREVLDEDAVMPQGWEPNEPLTVSDTSAVKPADWDDDEDGEWQPPEVSVVITNNAVRLPAICLVGN